MKSQTRRALVGARFAGQHFISTPWAGGVVLLVCVAVAMLLANLPFTSGIYTQILETDLSVHISGRTFEWVFPADMSVEKFINDGLMVVFFFVVGLEIKREVISGQLSTFRQAILPVVAALGGMLFPALIYLLFNGGTPMANGWGIPTATDIAFAIGILSLLGDKVPVSLKIFLTALAIADDLGAILVIALFYGQAIHWTCLAIAAVILFVLWMLKRGGEYRTWVFLVPAIAVWGLFYYSGVHATLSGVAMAMVLPVAPRCRKGLFAYNSKRLIHSMERLDESDPETGPALYARLSHLRHLANHSIGMSSRWEQALNPYVTFVVMPIFALANAGVHIESLEYFAIFRDSPQTGFLAMGIFFGLLLGKPLGIFLFSWISIRLGLAVMPRQASWRMLFAVACLGGIGFTMAIFVDGLAFLSQQEPLRQVLIDQGKIAILLGSVAASVLGVVLINFFSRRESGKIKRR